MSKYTNSWDDPIVRQKRLTRHTVFVNGYEYQSLYVAMQNVLGHTRRFHQTRLSMKKDGLVIVDGIKFNLGNQH